VKIANVILNKLDPFLKKVHIAIVYDAELFTVKVKIFQGSKKIKEELKLYEMEEEQLPRKMVIYLQKLQKNYGYCYISTFLSSINVGAIQGCSGEDFNSIGVDINNVVKVCVEERWTAYSSHYDIRLKEDIYEKIGGLDYIFPIELMMNQMIQNLNFQSNEPIVYLLQSSNSATLSIFNNQTLLYSTHFLFSKEDNLKDEGDLDEMNDLIESSEESVEELDEIVHLDDEDNDLLDDIEDLDDIVVDEDNLELEDVNSVDDDADNILDDEGLDDYQDEISLKHDMMLFEFVKHALEDYYKDDKYQSEFLSKAVIFSTDKVERETLRNYLQNELLLACNLVQVDLASIMIELSLLESTQELNNA
jgi:hypothetical protein